MGKIKELSCINVNVYSNFKRIGITQVGRYTYTQTICEYVDSKFKLAEYGISPMTC